MNAAALPGLLAAVGATLDAVSGPGGATVRARLHHAPAPPVEPLWPDVVARHLPAALAAAGPRHGLARALAAAAPALRWTTYDAYPADRIGAAFRDGHAFAPLIGEADAPYGARDFDLGFLLIAPGLLYVDHRHPAPELYLPLTGPHGWRFDGAGDFAPLPAWQPVWNPPWRIHATHTGDVPFLALYAWTEQASAPAELVSGP